MVLQLRITEDKFEVLKVQGIMYLRPKYLVFCILLVALDSYVSSTSNGGDCVEDINCDSGNCCEILKLSGKCQECCKDSDCPSRLSCDFWNGKCVDARPIGYPCTPDSDCASGHCCYIFKPGILPFKKCRECCDDSDCQSNGKANLKCIFDKCQWIRKRLQGCWKN